MFNLEDFVPVKPGRFINTTPGLKMNTTKKSRISFSIRGCMAEKLGINESTKMNFFRNKRDKFTFALVEDRKGFKLTKRKDGVYTCNVKTPFDEKTTIRCVIPRDALTFDINKKAILFNLSSSLEPEELAMIKLKD